jgi:arginyl-tRNA synthetase
VEVKKAIQQALSEALKRSGVEIAPRDVPLEFPTELSHGDYATGIALKYAKEADTAPRALAEKIVAELGSVEGISKIDIAGPGFINFYLSAGVLAGSVKDAVETDRWGANSYLQGQVVLIEYTSPNLFKPLHIGNLVGNILGESLSRLMQFSGAHVERINYPSDIGLTVAKGVWGLRKTSGDPSDIKALGEAYRIGNEGYENDPAAKIEIDEVNKKLYEDTDPQLSALRKAGVETSRRHLDAICEQLGTKFDAEIFESEAAPVGRDIVLAHVGDVFEKSDGAIVYKGESEGLHTRVFVNSAGLPTYEAKDVGNFELKIGKFPDWTSSFVVTGAEQSEYFKVVIAAIKKLFPGAGAKTIRHIPTGFLTLTTGKMSSRKGNVLTGESLLMDLEKSANERAAESRASDKTRLAKDVATAAIKYQLLKQGSGKNMMFDKEKALSLEGDSGPYLQYAHARARAILEKAKEQNVVATFDVGAQPTELSRSLHRFPEVVERAAAEHEPHLITNYLLQIASEFNSWYAKEQILDGTATAAHKVALTAAVARTLKNGLWLLGIPAPEKM